MHLAKLDRNVTNMYGKCLIMHWTCVAPFDLILLNTLFVESFVEAAKKMSS